MPALRESIDRLLRNEFYRNILSLFSGMFLARLFPALFALLIVRIYSPGNFGIFVLYFTIASALSIISTGRYESAIILAGTEDEKRHIFWLSQKINALVNALAAILIVLYILLAGIPGKPTILLLLLIPVFSFFFASIQLLRNIFISNKQFKKLSFLEIARSLSTGVLQCLFFVFPETGLFLGAVISQILVFLIYARKIPETSWHGNFGFTKEEVGYGKRYVDFPKYSVMAEVFNFLSSQLPVFIIKPFFGPAMLGLYSFPHRYIKTPVQLLSSSISRVYVQKAQSLKNNIDELGDITLSLFKKQFITGIVPFAVLGLWGGQIFRFVFGAEWEFSGFMAQLITPWVFAVMLSSPLSSIMVVMEKQKLSMFYNVLLFVSRVVCLLTGAIIFKDIAWAVGLYSSISFVFFVALLIYSLKLAGASLVQTAKFVLKTLIITLPPLIILRLWI